MAYGLSAAAALLLAGVHALQLLASAYERQADLNIDRPTDERTAVSADLAARLTPWVARRQGLLGWILTARRQAAETRYLAALRWSPAEPLLWVEYAQALARSGHFDGRLQHATRRAQVLAMSSPAVQSGIAAIGVSYWSRGTAEMREAWLLAMRFERDYNRTAFLEQVLVRGQALTFCSDAALRLGEQAWCDAIRRAIADCRRQQRTSAGYMLCGAAP